MKLVQVEWADSMTESEWRAADDIKRRADDANALYNITVGWLLFDEPDYMVLAQTHTPGVDGDKPMYGNTTHIPRSALVSAPKALRTGR